MLSLQQYSLHLADNALVLGHRNSEWTGHGPILEQDIALSNISLDLIGQARNFYQYAAELINTENPGAGSATEDTLAYLRSEDEFLNCLIAEQENGDWGKTILRQFFFSAYQYPLYQQLMNSSNDRLSSIAEKSLKEVTYHLRWSSEWVIRLGQGTEESHRRMNNAMLQLWKFTEELYTFADFEQDLSDKRIAHNVSLIKSAWRSRVGEVLDKAGISIPLDEKMKTGGKKGKHTGSLHKLLEEMQYMQRTYPGVEW